MAVAHTQIKHAWISWWFFLSAFLVAWDCGYIFLRPRSMEGGDLHWPWKPYALYAKIDYIYGLPSFEGLDGFPNAQSTMNVVEYILNFTYLYKTHISPSSSAPLIGLIGAVMTWSKTVLYWLQDFYCGPNGWCMSGHNPWFQWIYLWAIPNVSSTYFAWIVFPFLITIVLGKDIASALRVAAKSASNGYANGNGRVANGNGVRNGKAE